MADDAVETVGRGEYEYPVGYKCDIEPYRILKRCSDRKDMAEWNEWRLLNNEENIYIQGAQLCHMHFNKGDFSRVYCQRANFRSSYFIKSNFIGAHCSDADFTWAKCINTIFSHSYCENTLFRDAKCQKALFQWANCKHADFWGALCNMADFRWAHCEHANFWEIYGRNAVFSRVDCHKAKFWRARCKGVDFSRANLVGTIFNISDISMAKFISVNLDGNSEITECTIDGNTLVLNSSLSAIIIEPGARALLERNARKFAWEQWYPTQNLFVRNTSKLFWFISDYGYKTIRIFVCFFVLISFFAVIYTFFPDVLNAESRVSCESIAGRLFRMLSFSTATMVTLGFSNTNVNTSPASYLGTFLVTLNLLVGYFMLAVLVTRIGILFQTMGPGLEIENKKKISFAGWREKTIERVKVKWLIMNTFKTMGEWWQNKLTSWRKPKQ